MKKRLIYHGISALAGLVLLMEVLRVLILTVA